MGKIGERWRGGWGRVVNYMTDWGKVQEKAGKGRKNWRKVGKDAGLC